MARDVSGEWTIVQSNGFEVLIDLVQRGPAIHGAMKVKPGGPEANTHGEVTDQALTLDVDWPNGTHGKYTGQFAPDGVLSGVTFDLANPTSQATWFSRRAFP